MFQVIKLSPTCLVLLGPTYLRNSPRRPWLGKKHRSFAYIFFHNRGSGKWVEMLVFERELLLEGPMFHWTMIMGGRIARGALAFPRLFEWSLWKYLTMVRKCIVPAYFLVAPHIVVWVCLLTCVSVYINICTQRYLRYHLFTHLSSYHSQPLTYLSLHLTVPICLLMVYYTLLSHCQALFGSVQADNIPGTGNDHKVHLPVKGCRLTGEPWKWRYLLLFVFSLVWGSWPAVRRFPKSWKRMEMEMGKEHGKHQGKLKMKWYL